VHPTVREAREIEYDRRRRAISAEIEQLAFTLDRPILSLFRFNITIAPRTLKRFELWLFTAIHTGLFFLKREGINVLRPATNSYTPVSNWGLTLELAAVAIPSGFMSLLLVFFNGQCYTRYISFYTSCVGMTGALQEIAETTSVIMATHPQERWDVCRYCVAAAICVYSKVVDLSQNKPAKMDDEDWERLCSSEEAWLGKPVDAPSMPALLTEKEHLVLKECAGKEFQVLQMWALETAFRAYQAVGADGFGGGHGHHYIRLEESVLKLRAHGAAITNLLDMPIPFPYYHVLVAIMFANYILYTFCFLDINSYLTPLGVFLVIFLTTAMRELSSALANPFGDDEVDFNISAYIHKMRKLISFLGVSQKWRLDAYQWVEEEKPRALRDVEGAFSAIEPPPQMPQMRQMPPDALQPYSLPYESFPAVLAPPPSGDRLALERHLAEQGAQIAALQASIHAANERARGETFRGPMEAMGETLGAPMMTATLPTASGDSAALPPPAPMLQPPSAYNESYDSRAPSSTMPLPGARRAPPPLPVPALSAPAQVRPSTLPPIQPTSARAVQPLVSVASSQPATATLPAYQYQASNGKARWTAVAPGAPGTQAGADDEEILFEKGAP